MLGRKTFLSLLSLLFIRFAQGIILIIAVKNFLTVEFGYVTAAQSLLAFFLFFSDLNLSTAHLKLMAEQKEKSVAFSTYFYLKIFLMIVSSITFIFIIIISLNLNIVTNNISQISIIIVVFFDRMVISMLMVYYYSFQATLKIAKKEMSTIIGQIIGLIFGLISILVLHNFILYLLNTTISNLFSLALCIYYGREFKLSKINKALLIRYLKLDVIFVLPFFLNVLITNLGPLIFLQQYNADLLGVYNVIANFFLMILGIQQVFRSLLIPNYSVLIQNEKYDVIKKSIDLFEKYMAILNGIIIVFGILFGDYFLRILFGQVYLDYGWFLYLGYLISLISFSILGPFTPLIVASEKFKVYTINLFISLVFAIISWIFFIPLIDIVGINIGTWISTIPQAIFIRYFCFRYFKFGKMSLKYGLNLLVISGMILISLFLYTFHFLFFIRIIFALVLIAAYLVFLIITKLFTKKDFRYILSVINPKEMIDYIREETINS